MPTKLAPDFFGRQRRLLLCLRLGIVADLFLGGLLALLHYFPRINQLNADKHVPGHDAEGLNEDASESVSLMPKVKPVGQLKMMLEEKTGCVEVQRRPPTPCTVPTHPYCYLLQALQACEVIN